jgi:DHA1 family tetracycline resistance protein-like MFS transporter
MVASFLIPSLDIKPFFVAFATAKGAIPALILSTLLSFGIGSTVGIVPEILSDRYSRLYHGYSGQPCFMFDHDDMPAACMEGADDAQAASAWGALLLNMLTLLFNPVVGSLSDVHGRRLLLSASIFLCTLPPMVLLLMQKIPSMDPMWYYLANSIVGVVNYISITFAALSDSMPEEFRAPSFALIMAGFYGGFALAPSFPLLMNHFQVSILSFALVLGSFAFTLLFFPETLPDAVAETNRQAQEESTAAALEETNTTGTTPLSQSFICKILTRPFREMVILNRNLAIRLVAVGSFFSSMVFATDANLVIFYIEEHLNVRDKDIAQMFFIMGIMGILFQAFLLQPLVKCLGEKGLLVTAFLSGTLHNFLYGVAHNKRTIYVALCFSQLTKTNYPILSSLASKSASVNEQGQVQGALFALNALASAIGPLSMQFIYDKTKDSLGPGTMFLFASCLYFTGAIVVSMIPVRKVGQTSEGDFEEGANDLEEPLLIAED